MATKNAKKTAAKPTTKRTKSPAGRIGKVGARAPKKSAKA